MNNKYMKLIDFIEVYFDIRFDKNIVIKKGNGDIFYELICFNDEWYLYNKKNDTKEQLKLLKIKDYFITLISFKNNKLKLIVEKEQGQLFYE